MQLAGQICPVCGEPIRGITDGTTCDDCGSPIHQACAPVEPIRSEFDGCISCGTTYADLQYRRMRKQESVNAINSEHESLLSAGFDAILFFGFPAFLVFTIPLWGFIPLHFLMVIIAIFLAVRKFLRLNPSL